MSILACIELICTPSRPELSLTFESNIELNCLNLVDRNSVKREKRQKKTQVELKHILILFYLMNLVQHMIRSTFDPELILCSSNQQLQSITTTVSIETQSADLN